MLASNILTKLAVAAMLWVKSASATPVPLNQLVIPTINDTSLTLAHRPVQLSDPGLVDEIVTPLQHNLTTRLAPRDKKPTTVAVGYGNGQFQQHCAGSQWAYSMINYRVEVKQPNAVCPGPEFMRCAEEHGFGFYEGPMGVLPCGHEKDKTWIIIYGTRQQQGFALNYCLTKVYPDVDAFNCPDQ